ncbi:hypothetical protein CXG81DRAFT_23361 [Caulochytrium protostelioides]|uniref:Uncharacterized protein n=1 Tax=Caulochytrium protostelioides TaxID=1555241 RepID=A0A4P9XEK4_9FUNG|nr:hypothetical protein CXG81DRAFT_23361 [Caulochytrium protostelioides]|eukprot:RKP03948.1 hypothetical protein CXG81DRAFT_23361 [Caulochytrium protostelioides]
MTSSVADLPPWRRAAALTLAGHDPADHRSVAPAAEPDAARPSSADPAAATRAVAANGARADTWQRQAVAAWPRLFQDKLKAPHAGRDGARGIEDRHRLHGGGGIGGGSEADRAAQDVADAAGDHARPPSPLLFASDQLPPSQPDPAVQAVAQDLVQLLQTSADQQIHALQEWGLSSAMLEAQAQRDLEFLSVAAAMLENPTGDVTASMTRFADLQNAITAETDALRRNRAVLAEAEGCHAALREQQADLTRDLQALRAWAPAADAETRRLEQATVLLREKAVTYRRRYAQQCRDRGLPDAPDPLAAGADAAVDADAADAAHQSSLEDLAAFQLSDAVTRAAQLEEDALAKLATLASLQQQLAAYEALPQDPEQAEAALEAQRVRLQQLEAQKQRRLAPQRPRSLASRLGRGY